MFSRAGIDRLQWKLKLDRRRGHAFTLAGTPDAWTSAVKTHEVWMVQYDDKRE